MDNVQVVRHHLPGGCLGIAISFTFPRKKCVGLRGQMSSSIKSNFGLNDKASKSEDLNQNVICFLFAVKLSAYSW